MRVCVFVPVCVFVHVCVCVCMCVSRTVPLHAEPFLNGCVASPCLLLMVSFVFIIVLFFVLC